MGELSVNNDEHVFRSKYSPVSVPENTTLPEFVLKDALHYADKVAIVEASTGDAYTYGEVVRDTARFARALRSLGLRKGHVVMVVLPNLAVYPVVSLGIMTAGGVFSGVNPLALGSEIQKQVADSDAKLIVANQITYDKVKELGIPTVVVGEDPIPNAINWKDLLEASDRAGPIAAAEKLAQSDLCALPYSSGTTGSSKGVMLTHRNLVSNLCSSLFSVSDDMVGQVTTLGLMPFFHIYGITGICCAALRNKGKVVVMGRFDLRCFMEALIVHEVNFAPIVPAIMLSMVKSSVVDEFDLGKLKLRSVLTAAAPLAPDLRAAFEDKFPGVDIQEAYGLTEHSCITLTHGDPRKGHGIAKRNSVGFILPNLEVKFVDPETGRSLPENKPGEICVRSQCVMQGYYKNEEETSRMVDREGWLHTGDIGYIDEDGDVFIVDRIKELIKYKGFQVAPAELEAVLLSHPSVEDVAVFGSVYPSNYKPLNLIHRSLDVVKVLLTCRLPDEDAGEVPAACVVMNGNAKHTEEEMMSYVASNVASYKRVRVLHFVDSIPKSPSGKIMRRFLRDNLARNGEK